MKDTSHFHLPIIACLKIKHIILLTMLNLLRLMKQKGKTSNSQWWGIPPCSGIIPYSESAIEASAYMESILRYIYSLVRYRPCHNRPALFGRKVMGFMPKVRTQALRCPHFLFVTDPFHRNGTWLIGGFIHKI